MIEESNWFAGCKPFRTMCHFFQNFAPDAGDFHKHRRARDRWKTRFIPAAPTRSDERAFEGAEQDEEQAIA